MAKLVLLEGTRQVHTYDLGRDVLFLGRSTKNDIQIKDLTVSRRQMKLFTIGKKVFVEDLKSTNGTLINGEIIKPGESFELREGDTITVGKTRLRFTNAGAGTDPKFMALTFPDSQSPSKRKTSSQECRHRSSADIELVYRISRLLRGPIEMDLFFDKVLDLFLSAFPRIDTAAIILFDEEKRTLGKGYSRVREKSGKKPHSYSEKVVMKVVKEGKALRMSNMTYEASGAFGKGDNTLEIGSVLCVPLISNSRILGAVYVDSRKRPYGFRRDDLLLLNSITGSLALFIEKTTWPTFQKKPLESQRA
jgi:hypothetical protein